MLRNLIAGGLLVVAGASQFPRWWRVLQREHYIVSSLWRSWGRWLVPNARAHFSATPRWVTRWRRGWPVAATVITLSLAGYVISPLGSSVGVAIALVLFPYGLSWRGRTAPLHFTRRLKVVAVLSVALALVVTSGAVAMGGLVALELSAIVVPLWVGLATLIAQPFEERAAQRFVDSAAARLTRVKPRVVAITGSFGKTSTKNHLVSILSPVGGVVATPRSFNNRAGLSRAINENLADGTSLFIAEMGTYGPGEIAALCEWCPPDISVVTAIGEVHLERMGSVDVIDRAKKEITVRADIVILNGDDERLRAWIDDLVAAGKTVVTAGTGAHNDLQVACDADEWVASYRGETVGRIAAIQSIHPTNVACALAVGIMVGQPLQELWDRVPLITPVANRAVVATAASGVVVIDDTFNANPASAAASLKVLQSLPLTGRRVVVTPGLVEMGHRQAIANEEFAQAVSAAGAELVVVGRTNARALVRGSGGARIVRRRDDAVAWVRAELATGDGVLYLNDLPDHYA